MATSDLGGKRVFSASDVDVNAEPIPSPTNDNSDGDSRDSWSSRYVFWLAAVGSAVGLGNLWRFPWQCAKWGGGAFILAYFVCLFTLGMPLLTQELALGQKHRSGDIEAFGRMNWRLRGIGLASVIGGFGIVTYYMMIIGVSTVFFFESFISPLPYGDADGSSYWISVLQLSLNGIEESEWTMSGKLFLATCFCWLITFFCIMKGVKSASWAVKVTMPLPLLLLLILLIKGATLEGSWKGIKAYWDFSNWDSLSDSGIWNAAIGQCFFSLSVCMGVMTAYGSYNPRRQDIATDEKVIAFLDVGVSIMSGFVVYAVLGYLTVTVPLEEGQSYFDDASILLVFSAFPVAISTFAGANFFGVIFYLTLMLLGIDSAFSIVEAISTVIVDSDLNVYRLKWSRFKISAILCVAGAFGSSLYCFDTGLYWFDIVDRYINNYGMVFLGICETGACGWFYQYHLIEQKVGTASANLYRIGYWFSVIFACFLAFALATPVHVLVDGKWVYEFTGTLGGDSWFVGFIVGIACWAITILLAYLKRSEHCRQNMSFGETMWYIMGWENVEVLRDFMNGNGLGDAAWSNSRHTLQGEAYAGVHHSSIGIWWGFLIKYFVPTVLTVNLISTMRGDRWNVYEGYPWSTLALGIIIFSAMVLVVFVVAVRPQLMAQKVDESGEYDNMDQHNRPIVTIDPEEEEEEEEVLVDKEEKDKETAVLVDTLDDQKESNVELVKEDKAENVENADKSDDTENDEAQEVQEEEPLKKKEDAKDDGDKEKEKEKESEKEDKTYAD